MQERLVRLLQSCSHKGSTKQKLSAIHAQILKNSLTNTALHNTLLNAYLSHGFLAESLQLFEQVRRKNACSWTAMISGYAKLGFHDHAVDFFRQMRLTHIAPNHFTYSSALSACSVSLCPQIHANILKAGFDTEIVVRNSLIHRYVRTGSLEHARQVFEEMSERERDSFSWTSLIAGYAQNGDVEKALRLFNEASGKTTAMWNALIGGFQQTGFCDEALKVFRLMDSRPNSRTFVTVISLCVELGMVFEGTVVHGKIVASGLGSDLLLVNSLIDMYSKFGEMDLTLRVFAMSRHRDIVSWNSVLAGYAQNGLLGSAMEFFEAMPVRDLVSWNIIVAGLAESGLIEKAKEIFHENPVKTVVSWNAMIAGLVGNGKDEEATEMFREMVLGVEKPDSKTLSTVLSSCANVGAAAEAMEIHGKIITGQFEGDRVTLNALLDVYGRSGRLEMASLLFGKLQEKDTVSWNVLISGYVFKGFVDKAVQLLEEMPLQNVISWNTVFAGLARLGKGPDTVDLFRKMLLAGLEPDSDSFSSVLPLISELGDVGHGMEIHAKTVTSFVVCNVFVLTALSDMYCQFGNVVEAWKLFQKIDRKDKDIVAWNVMISGFAENGFINNAILLFHKMPERNNISWNIMVAGLRHNGYFDQSLNVFQQMQMEGFEPDLTTLTTILSVCIDLSSLKQGREVHNSVLRSGLSSDPLIINALIDMYAKCGSIEEASKLFQKLKQKDITTWNIMIGAYALHGCGREALECLQLMQKSGTSPDHCTFLNILLACNHGGLVPEAHTILNDMTETYNLEPSVKHYLCLIDLLGRSGNLDDALHIISVMPVKPDVRIWKCLLGACRLHNNVDLAEKIANRLFELDPTNTSPYVLLSNIYARAGRWTDVEKTRKLMKDRGLRKHPGCSWIEINKTVYHFLS